MLAKRIVVCKDHAGEEQRGNKKDDRFKQYMKSAKTKKRNEVTKRNNKIRTQINQPKAKIKKQ